MRSPETSTNADQAAAVVLRLRAGTPRVHCITNTVAQNFTANALLAAGCIPSMTLSAEEIGIFVAGADALMVNLGTLDSERRQAAEIAVTAAAERGLPWVLSRSSKATTMRPDFLRNAETTLALVEAG